MRSPPETSGWAAEINAFALGAEMVDPHVMVCLKWYSAKDCDWVRELDETDVHIVCARDVPDPLLPDVPWGLSSGVLDIDIADCVPVRQRTLVELVRQSMMNSQMNQFSSELKSQTGLVQPKRGRREVFPVMAI